MTTIVTVMSSGSFQSITEQFEIADEIAKGDRETEILHIGAGGRT
jgi:hypothetical protein